MPKPAIISLFSSVISVFLDYRILQIQVVTSHPNEEREHTYRAYKTLIDCFKLPKDSTTTK